MTQKEGANTRAVDKRNNKSEIENRGKLKGPISSGIENPLVNLPVRSIISQIRRK
ncbi:MAG TPA: hypothetical protein VF884_06030 [Nitrososphaeraceae archaeon]